MSTQPQPMPSFTGFLQTLWNDVLNFFAAITGRTYVGPPTSPAAFTVSPIGTNPLQGVATVAAPGTTFGSVAPVRAPKPTITVQQALQAAIASESKINPKDLSGYLSYSGSNWTDVVVNRYQIYFDANVCGGVGAPDMSIQEAASGVSVAGAGAGLVVSSAAIPVLGLAVAGAELIIMGVGQIFAHHNAAVARDRVAYCGTLPAINNALRVVINAGKDGTITPAQAVAGLKAIPQQALISMEAAKNNSPYCNALCEKIIETRVIVNYWVSQFEAMQ